MVSNITEILKNYTCYESLTAYETWLNNNVLWIKCIGTIALASIGILGNIMVMLVLRRMYSNFNRLLLVLSM